MPLLGEIQVSLQTSPSGLADLWSPLREPPNSPSIRQYLPTSTSGLCQPDYLVNKLTTRYNTCTVRTSNLRNSLCTRIFNPLLRQYQR